MDLISTKNREERPIIYLYTYKYMNMYMQMALNTSIRMLNNYYVDTLDFLNKATMRSIGSLLNVGISYKK